MKRTSWLPSWLLLLACACGDGPSAAPRQPLDNSTDPAMGNGCVGQDGGAPCKEGFVCIEGTCRSNVCGDGVQAGEEQCDDGNQLLDDDCTPSCKSVPPNCGDSIVDPDEECDDANWYDLDRCSNACTVNECGNKREDGDEECDDGNLENNDACTNDCKENRCRNGVKEPGEECDDGNTDPHDGCTNACRVVECGDGKVDGPERGGSEECDDGNDVDDDACANLCTANVCGNMRTDPGEVCDGNTATLSCADDCKSTAGNSACAECRDAHCKNYMDAIDLVTPCLDNPAADFETQCSALIDCAHRNRCGFTQGGMVAGCFCGSEEPDAVAACQRPEGALGPCVQEAFAAARTSVHSEVIGFFGDVSLPIGMATYLLACETQYCLEQCGP